LYNHLKARTRFCKIAALDMQFPVSQMAAINVLQEHKKLLGYRPFFNTSSFVHLE
jgi:hypothetical protein